MASSSARASLLAHYGPSTIGRTGTRKLTVVPRFGWLSMLIEPPADAIRERMLPSPWRREVSLPVLSNEWQNPGWVVRVSARRCDKKPVFIG
ncbi:MAG: hypothetical protein ACOYLU_01685 [Limisphaerales bacterium]